MNPDGNLRNSRPCHNCLDMMQAVNIRRIYYVDDNCDIVYENVQDMISIQASTVARQIYSIIKNINYTDSKTKYYTELLIKMFPAKVKRKNFDNFVHYDFKNYLPNYNYIVKIVKNVNIIVIYDDNNKEILKSILVD